MNIKRGDIIWLKENTPLFNVGENVQYPNRPYIVVSNNQNNDKAPTLNLACLSKQVKKAKYPMHVFLDKKKYKLCYDSVVYAEQLCTVNKKYVKEIVSSLDEEDMKKFNRALYVQVINENIEESVEEIVSSLDQKYIKKFNKALRAQVINEKVGQSVV